ncbi:hypothetical protein [Pontibacterium sp.]|uniref:hypothetical protein n=1 Tax=Pontibacterium sp. TaxID=2036026 RepID=UPI00356B5063
MELGRKLKVYYFTAVFSVMFSLLGFSYNAWRLEATEDNSNIRMAAFSVLNTLSELEQLVYAAHYDHDEVEGNPRKGWIKVGLISDLSSLIGPKVAEKAEGLRLSWGENWELLGQDNDSSDQIVAEIDEVRLQIKMVIKDLK